MDELQSPEGVEPCVQVAPERGLIMRLRHGFADRLEGPELAQRFLQKVGPEKRIALRQNSEDLCEVPSRSRDLAEHVEPAGQVREDERVKEAKVREASFLRDEVPDRAAGAEGHTIGRAALEKNRRPGQAEDRPYLGELVQDIEVLGGVFLREAAHGGI